jgi:hypothetical protein
MLESLNAPAGALVVMDRGIATEVSLAWLREQGYHYLVVSRVRRRQFDPEQATKRINVSGECLHPGKTLSQDATEVKLYCCCECRANKEAGIHGRYLQHFEAELDKIAAGLHKPRAAKRLDRRDRPTRRHRTRVRCRRRTGHRAARLKAVLRSLKSELDLHPVFHHKRARVDGPLFMTVLA